MSLILEGDLDILKIYPQAENEAVSLRHSKLRACIAKIRKYVSRSKVEVQMSKVLNYIERCRDRYSDQAPAVTGL